METNSKKIAPILLFLLCFTYSFSQSEDRVELEKEIWGKTQAQFKNNDIPEKWQQESAVILFQDLKKVYDKKMRLGKSYLLSETTFHTRIALLDKNAIKEFSEFSFYENANGGIRYRRGKEGLTVGFKVIKPSGAEQIIDLDKAVEVESEGNNTAKKIAIPNLQVGDMIDYFYHQTEGVETKTVYYFTPFISTLSTEYPAQYIRYRFETENTFYMSYLPLNGAPELQMTERDNMNIYDLEMKNIEKTEYPDLLYPNRSLPTIKHQVVFARGLNVGYYQNIYGKYPNSIKTKFEENELHETVASLYWEEVYVKPTIKSFKNYLKDKGKNIKAMSDEDIVFELYRWDHFKRIVAKAELYYLSGGKDPLPYGDALFVRRMRAMLASLDISGKILVTTSRENGVLDNMLLHAEAEFFLKVETEDGKDIYLSEYQLHPEMNRIPYQLEGQPAYTYPINKLGYLSIEEVQEEMQVPLTTHQENQTRTSSNIQFSTDLSKIQFSNKYEYLGHNKTYYQRAFTNFFDYCAEESAFYGRKTVVEQSNKRELVKNTQMVDELKAGIAEQIDEYIEESLKSDFAAPSLEVDDFKVINDGRMRPDNNNFSYEVSGSFDELIQQAGPNYLLNAGLLISKQREVKPKDRKRTVDVYMSSARSFHNVITIRIPEGYTVEGVEKLNMKVENETGGFVSTAELKDKELLIHTQKWYANNFEPVENWPKMVEFLDAAYQFTEVNVLFKKQ